MSSRGSADTSDDETTAIESFFGRPPVEVAPQLLGSRFRCNGVTVRLTEVEAYHGALDPASHAYRGPTARNSVMFGPPGRVYVYFIYGLHWAVNLVCQAENEAAAVLLRAGEVEDGEEAARTRRGVVPARQLARGPGNLAATLGVDSAMTGSTLWAGPLRWQPSDALMPFAAGPRVGVGAAEQLPWRFWVPGDATVSAYRRAKKRRED